jgi:transcription initiation factor TFIIIB Brf1 subunit/transcription initiation factor TFIIB
MSLKCIFRALETHPRLTVRDRNIPLDAKQSCGSTACGKENKIIGHMSHFRRLLPRNVNVRNKGGNSVKAANESGTATLKTEAQLLPDEFLFVSEYSSCIIEYLQQTEKEKRVSMSIRSKYAANHSIVVDWLTRVQHRLSLSGCTLHTAVSLLDTAIFTKEVRSHELQLVACTALWIAAKCDMKKEVPAVSIFCSLSEFSFSKADMYAMEVTLLNLSGFNLHSFNPLTFVSYYLHKLSVKSDKIYYACNYFLDVMYRDINFSTKRPSLLAAAAVYAVLQMYQKQGLWKQKENREGFYALDKIQTISDIMLNKLKNSGSDTGAYKKYNSTRYNRLSAALCDLFKLCCSSV